MPVLCGGFSERLWPQFDKAVNLGVKLWILGGFNLQLHFVKGIHFIIFGHEQNLKGVCCVGRTCQISAVFWLINVVSYSMICLMLLNLQFYL